MTYEKEIRYSLTLSNREEEIMREAINVYVDFWSNTHCGPESVDAVAWALDALETLDKWHEDSLETFSRGQIEVLCECLRDLDREVTDKIRSMRRTPRRILGEMITMLDCLLQVESETESV